MYRILRENQEIRERRNQGRHPNYTKPELLATGPNQVWSWDITKLLGPVTGTYFFLYVMLDIFSRFVVGWLIAERESAELAQALIAEACTRQSISPDQLTIHADRGGPMTAKPVALLLADLGVVKSHSRPHVSNDNPFSEAHFKTLKYHPTFPDRFGSQVDARAWAQPLFRWYNWEHHHTSLGLLTPGAVHYGQALHLWTNRQLVLRQAYIAHPERFVKGVPQPPVLPTEAWINPPKAEEADFFEFTVAHEVGHQWFYGLIGSDPVSEPWLDESAASYTEVLYAEAVYGPETAAQRLRIARDYLAYTDHPSLPIGRPIDAYTSEGDYGIILYMKGKLFFDALRRELGDQAFFAFLQNYAAAYRYGFATSADFQAVAEATCACDLDALFDLWVYRGGPVRP